VKDCGGQDVCWRLVFVYFGIEEQRCSSGRVLEVLHAKETFT
jgi:hypothetical protein